jgi:acylphosphatase
MKKHLNIFIEGKLENADFNFYSQSGAYRFDIHAVYKNGDSRHVDLEAEGDEEKLLQYVEYLQTGPLKKHIELFRTEEAEFIGIDGFKSLKVHQDKFSLLEKLKRRFKK